jgi:hypothetical protein
MKLLDMWRSLTEPTFGLSSLAVHVGSRRINSHQPESAVEDRSGITVITKNWEDFGTQMVYNMLWSYL